MPYYVYSTMTGGVKYTQYYPNTAIGGGVNRVKKTVSVSGGANVATKQLVTPKGTVTTISDEDYEWLKNNLVFKKHLESGGVRVEKVNQKLDKMVANMAPKDKSAPAVPSDFEKPPIVGKLTNAAPGMV